MRMKYLLVLFFAVMMTVGTPVFAQGTAEIPLSPDSATQSASTASATLASPSAEVQQKVQE